MVRRRVRQLWLVGLLVVAAGIGMAGDTGTGPSEGHPAASRPAAATFTPSMFDAAVVPARTEAGPGTGSHQAPGRSLLPLLASLVAAVGAAGLTAARAIPAATGHRPLLARRHAIALRAPPSYQLV